MIRKRERRLRIGVLGAGPIAQFAHLESCAKAANADLHALCDAAPDLLAELLETARLLYGGRVQLIVEKQLNQRGQATTRRDA